MSFRNWAIRSALVWTLAAAILIATMEVSFAAALRDADWEPGPFSGVADFVADAFLWIHLGAALIVLLPAYWWQRRGGSGTAMVWLAFGAPLSLLALLALRRGTQSWDGLFLIVVGTAAFALSFVAALAIRMLVRPALDEG